MALSDGQLSTERRESKSSLPGSHRPGSPLHRRTYQACIPCRRRKVRCDLGSVDDPHDPPCVRCRRESKSCFFSATRRKRQPTTGDDEMPDGDPDDDYETRNGRKRLRGDYHPADDLQRAQSPVAANRFSRLIAPSSISSTQSGSVQQHPLTPGGSIGQPQPLRRPTSDFHASISPRTSCDGDHFPRPHFSPSLAGPGIAPITTGEDEQQNTAEKLLQTGIYSGHDALNLLFEAAGRSDDIAHQRAENSAHSSQPSAVARGVVTSQPPDGHIALDRQTEWSGQSYMGVVKQRRSVEHLPIDPAISNEDTFTKPPADADLRMGEYQDALTAWSSCRFVRAGWFTAQEAIEYIEYYYKFMAPLTPISPPSFEQPGRHSNLLTEEPILAMTLLTISSRYMRLSGPGGLSRSYAIHEKLWNYLRGMIERIVWGQEQFGASLGTSPMSQEGIQTSSTAPWRGLRKGSMRTLGTVESLMLLTEWHPRALHFPPGDDGDELIVNDGRVVVDDFEADGDAPFSQAQKGVGGKRIESWLEPAWRSDRMCWMLLGNALALSFELGVFDAVPNMTTVGTADRWPSRPEYRSLSHQIRASRLRTLLLVYLTQLSGRLEWPNPCDVSILTHLKLRTHATDPPQASDIPFNFDGGIEDSVLHCWVELTNLMRSGNEQLFPSRNYTRNLIQTGEYTDHLQHFQPRLTNWRRDFEKRNIPTFMRHILNIEIEYLTVYINSLALQAVVERCANPVGNTVPQNPEGASTMTPDGLSPRTRGYASNAPYSTVPGLYGGDQEHIKEVIEASRNLLRTVVDGLLPEGYLQHVPVRTYFRIVSGAMFLLKTFALGAKEDEVALSLGLMDSTVQALRTCVVDDVHLGIRFADLLDVLTKRIRSRFVRMAATGISNNRAESRSPAPNGHVRTSSHPQQQQQWQPTIYSIGGNQFGGVNGGSGFMNTLERRSTPNPLAGISTEAIDPGDSNISIMLPPPPPSFAFTPSSPSAGLDKQDIINAGGQSLGQNPGGNDSTMVGGDEYVADWLALPLDPLLNSYGAGGVTQTSSLMGPDVGGFDLLEILLNEIEEGENGSGT